MKLADVEAILRALNDAEVRYLIVGGLAVVAHGYVRATVDMDIVLHLERENVLRAMAALKEIGYRPLVPVEAADFADEQRRKLWRDESTWWLSKCAIPSLRAHDSTFLWKNLFHSTGSMSGRSGKKSPACARQFCAMTN